MRYLITGVVGTVGRELAYALICNDKEVTGFSRNEDAQIQMKKEFPTCKFFVGDVRDYQECLRATKNIDVVYHLAAMKHVTKCEEQPQEATKTNVLGTMNIVNAALYNGVKELVYLSTDKAVNPTSVYGATKYLAEKIVLNAGYSVLRSGNILGSSNSIIPILREQISKTNSVKITCGDMTRFYIPLEVLVELLTGNQLQPGKIFIPKMSSFQLIDLARELFRKYGEGEFQCEETGMKPGERKHEFLFNNTELPFINETKTGYIIGTKAINKITEMFISYNFVSDSFKKYI